jgi:hypothetical protein
MGKKKKKYNRAKRQTARKKTVQPDDYFSYGPLEIARFGRFNVFRSNMTNEQFNEMQIKLVERFPKVCHEIDNKISAIVEEVRKLPPAEILKRAYWEMAAHHLNVGSEIDIDQEAALSLRMVDYLQSIIASVPPTIDNTDELTEEKWHNLRKMVGDLFSQLNMEYQICRTAVNRAENPDYDEDFEEYYYKAQIYWCNVRGHRYLVHEIPFFRDVLAPHNEVLNELFGISTNGIIDAVQTIQDSLTRGIAKVMEDFREFQQVTTLDIEKKIKGMNSISEDALPNIMEQVIKENGWEEWRDDVLGRLLGLDMFDLQKISKLPVELLDELSWEPGEDSDFFTEGNYKGWPLRIWPIFKRPFIKLDNHYYCFELYSLFDNLYRALQRIIIRKKPEYRVDWNEKQQAVSERIPCDLLKKLLPGAQVQQSVYYCWHTGQGGSKQWCEADALLVYEDHLFVIEVKAGAFTYTSPATDFPAYIESLKNLVFKPAEQGRRFLEYFESDEEVSLFDNNHNEIGKISKKDFENTHICAVTLDPFTELAAQAQHLKNIGIDVGEHPIWSISIDDLRVYSDIFGNPLIFLHFVEQRMRAFQSRLIKTEDELDHLGLYLKHNIYTQYVKDFNTDRPVMWHGYRAEIDRYFTKKLHDPNTICSLKQNMPARLKEIIDFLAASSKTGRRKVSSMLLDCGGTWRNHITSGIDDVLNQQHNSGHAKPLSTYGDIKISLFCWQEGILESDKNLALEHSQAAMLITNDEERLLLELYFNASGSLIDVDFIFLKLEAIPEQDLERLKALAETLRRKRIEKAKQSSRKIGPNEPCPCGSGKKYKKCCLKRPFK